MGFPNERENGTESTPRRSRRDRKGDQADTSTFAGAFTPADTGGSGPVRGPGAGSGAGPGTGPRPGGAPDGASGMGFGGFGGAAGNGPGGGPGNGPGNGPAGSPPYGPGGRSGGTSGSGAGGGPDGTPGGPDTEADPGRRKGRKDRKEAGQPRQTWSPYDEGPRSRGPLWATLGGVVTLGLLGGGLALMYNAEDPAATAIEAARRTSAPLPSAPSGKFGYAGSRTTDPDPLTVKELFATKKVTISGRDYQMTITSKDKKCSDGVLGTKITKALKSGKCTQMMRASFRDKAGKVIGTVGVANLKTSKNATKVASSGGASDYVKPLAGKDEVTKFLGSGSGGAKVWTHGHYAIMVWFQSKDGVKPDKKASKQLFQAADDITKATVYKALDFRALTGTRAT